MRRKATLLSSKTSAYDLRDDANPLEMGLAFFCAWLVPGVSTDRFRITTRIVQGKILAKSLRAIFRVAFVVPLASYGLAAGAATTTGMDFVGGCPSGMPTELCDQGGNADVQNVAAILGVSEDLVTYLGEVLISTTGDIVAINSKSGDWSVSDSSITHLAFKASTYHILGELTDSSGEWSTDVLDWSPDVNTVTCPASICGVERNYEAADFRNGGGNVAGLSNVRAFSVVPIPAAAWLFASALGLLGWIRRR